MDFSDYWSDVVWSTEMPSFDCLHHFHSANGAIQKLAEINVTQVERHTNQFEQTLRLLKCEEKVNYLNESMSLAR